MRRLSSALLAATAAAAVLTAPLAAQSISYANFSNTAGLQLNGNAFQNGNKLTLTSANFTQAGSAFSTTPLTLNSNVSFSTVFSFEILNRGGCCGFTGADGLMFVLQPNSNTAGGAGGGIGYAGISNSMGVEFDTFDNGEVGGSNHVGINLNGSVNSVASTGQLSPDFDNGSTWWGWVDYNGTNDLLEVRWSGSNARPTNAGLSYTVDLTSIFGTTNVYAGFTSGTGAAYGEHNILSWNFVNDYVDGGAPDPGVVPEPATYALVGTGLLGVIGFGRRRRR